MIKGFEKAKKGSLHRIVMSVEGQEKCGKTHFALTAPGPIALIDMDTGLEGVVGKFAKEKEIYVKSYNWKDATSQAEWTSMWEDSKGAFLAALKEKEIRTLIVDTGTEWYEMIRLARFGKLNKVAMADGKAVPFPYGPVNTEFRDLIKKVYEGDKNLILIHKLKKEYIKDTFTGKYERAGFGDIPYIVQLNMRVWRKDGELGFTVHDSRHNAEVAGLEMMAPMCDFETLAGEVFPDSKREEWS